MLYSPGQSGNGPLPVELLELCWVEGEGVVAPALVVAPFPPPALVSIVTASTCGRYEQPQ